MFLLLGDCQCTYSQLVTEMSRRPTVTAWRTDEKLVGPLQLWALETFPRISVLYNQIIFPVPPQKKKIIFPVSDIHDLFKKLYSQAAVLAHLPMDSRANPEDLFKQARKLDCATLGENDARRAKPYPSQSPNVKLQLGRAMSARLSFTVVALLHPLLWHEQVIFSLSQMSSPHSLENKGINGALRRRWKPFGCFWLDFTESKRCRVVEGCRRLRQQLTKRTMNAKSDSTESGSDHLEFFRRWFRSFRFRTRHMLIRVVSNEYFVSVT